MKILNKKDRYVCDWIENKKFYGTESYLINGLSTTVFCTGPDFSMDFNKTSFRLVYDAKSALIQMITFRIEDKLKTDPITVQVTNRLKQETKAKQKLWNLNTLQSRENRQELVLGNWSQNTFLLIQGQEKAYTPLDISSQSKILDVSRAKKKKKEMNTSSKSVSWLWGKRWTGIHKSLC